MSEYGVVLTTVGSEAEAEAIATALIEAELAACVNLFPVKSIYLWEGKMQRQTEWQLVIKTRLDCFDELSAKVQELHSYDVPELVALPIERGAASYLGWIGEQLG
jgi:periplasmic divalent cation tolerance protein